MKKVHSKYVVSHKTFLNISENVCKLQVKLLDTVTSIKHGRAIFLSEKENNKH